jgi:hypothetical protein
MLEATIGLNEVEAEPEETTESVPEDADGPFTRNDLTFLKSLRISLTEDATPETQLPAPRQHQLPPGTPDAPEA